MLPQIIPLAGTTIDWQSFLKACQETLGYNPLRGVDALHYELSDPAKYVAALAAFQNKANSESPLRCVKDAGSLLRHLSYTFLVKSDKELIFDIRTRTDLNIVSAASEDGDQVSVVTGNLQQYKAATLECCTPDSPLNTRYLFDAFVLFFEKVGLGEIWHDAKKRPLPDRTFLLEYKP